ncbi:hypothetical protein DFJ63DRAFT_333718 [Scheffersomyces coipomensis]|uniref:uncharacterized protein n=1 Tax=Scheffersomyces coipomensis TaxID=1788519 RepID=UPI00315C5C04
MKFVVPFVLLMVIVFTSHINAQAVEYDTSVQELGKRGIISSIIGWLFPKSTSSSSTTGTTSTTTTAASTPTTTTATTTAPTTTAAATTTDPCDDDDDTSTTTTTTTSTSGKISSIFNKVLGFFGISLKKRDAEDFDFDLDQYSFTLREEVSASSSIKASSALIAVSVGGSIAMYGLF